MRHPLALLILAFALTSTIALPGVGAQKPSEDAAVRAVMAKEAEGWSRFDPNELGSVFTDDAIFQNPFGVRLHGKAEIMKFLKDLLARPGFRAGTDTAPTRILDIRFTSPTTAAVWSDEQIKGLVNDYSGEPMQPRHSFYLEVLVKKDGEWKISDDLIMDLVHLQ